MSGLPESLPLSLVEWNSSATSERVEARAKVRTLPVRLRIVWGGGQNGHGAERGSGMGEGGGGRV